MSRARPTKVPSATRRLVTERDVRCPRCGVSTLLNAGEIHHRRSRRIHDDHTHCPCVAVRLCRRCHRDVTVNVAAALRDGWQVSSYQAEPWKVPLKTFAGWRLHTCEGLIVSVDEPTEAEREHLSFPSPPP